MVLLKRSLNSGEMTLGSGLEDPWDDEGGWWELRPVLTALLKPAFVAEL